MSAEALRRGDPDGLATAIAEHPFCTGLTGPQVTAMAHDAAVVSCPAGTFVFRRGAAADALYLIIEGTVALELADPGAQPLTIETLEPGEALGWSWLFPDRTWQFDARSVTDVTALALGAANLRKITYADAGFGRDLVLRIGRVVVDRLTHARAQLAHAHHHDRRGDGPDRQVSP